MTKYQFLIHSWDNLWNDNNDFIDLAGAATNFTVTHPFTDMEANYVNDSEYVTVSFQNEDTPVVYLLKQSCNGLLVNS